MEKFEFNLGKKENFDKYFNNKFVNKKIEGTDISFVKVEAKEPITKQYVIFVGGFATGAKEYKSEIKDLVESGRNVLFTNPIKGIEISEKDREVMDGFNLPETIQRKVSEVLQLVDNEGISRADLVGHSQGAIIASTIAALRPGIAEDLLLANPAGMHGDDTSSGIVGRTAQGFVAQVGTNLKRVFTQKEELKRISNVVGDVIFNGVQMHKSSHYRFSKEVPGIVATDIVPILNSIKNTKSELGETKVTLLTSNKDFTFPSKKIEGNIGLDYEENTPESFEETPIDSHVMSVGKDAGHEALIYEKEGILKQILNDKYKNQHQVKTD